MKQFLFVAAVFMLLCLCSPLFSQYGDNNGAENPATTLVNNNPTYNDGYRMGMASASPSPWWGVGSLVSGCCVGGLMPVSLGWGVPLVSAAAGSIPILVAAAGNPSPNPVMIMTMESKGPDYISGFKVGYGESKKKKNISSATVGMGISVALAIGAVLLIQANDEEVDE